MCGICGHFNVNNSHKLERERLEQMNHQLSSRGPDDEGYYQDQYISMGHKRLSIIDIESGKQPMTDTTKSLIISFNGEIYNYKELKKELNEHTFKTNSDTEVILEAYKKWSKNFLNKLNGMFALALWDIKEKKLILARDRMGQKPLFWHYSDKGLFWSSDINSLKWLSKEVNNEAINHYLSLQYIPEPLSIYENINKLESGHKIVTTTNSSPKTESWWEAEFEPKLGLDENELIIKSKEILEQSVKRSLVSDVPVGIFLSGGIDSSLITAIASKYKNNLDTFSIGFKDKKYSELKKAKQISNLFGTNHHEFYFTEKNLLESINDVVNAFGEPNADPASLALFYLANNASKHLKVVLTGDGADETCAGYTRYSLDKLFSWYRKLPRKIAVNLNETLANLFPESSNIPEDKNPSLLLRRLAQFYQTPNSCSMLSWSSYFSDSHKEKLLENNNYSSLKFVEEVFSLCSAKEHLDKTLFTDQKTYLSGNLLVKSDRMTMAHSLESRAPFLDNEWLEFSSKLPTRYKIKNLNTKYLLKKTLNEYIPNYNNSILKNGFNLPISNWIKENIHTHSKDIVLDSTLIRKNFKTEYIEKLFKEHKTGHINHGKRLWALIILAYWWDNANTID